ncbi:M12 family metallo-peptidase [Streptomyces klenkii]|uniref:M12 family metallo-peptidase n=1 Tax=Streptomyces klenkii TaxID=1420899 RepID=UPI001319EA83|nr:M12 family metallo-peptidase [Streptomyces klenkii]
MLDLFTNIQETGTAGRRTADINWDVLKQLVCGQSAPPPQVRISLGDGNSLVVSAGTSSTVLDDQGHQQRHWAATDVKSSDVDAELTTGNSLCTGGNGPIDLAGDVSTSSTGYGISSIDDQPGKVSIRGMKEPADEGDDQVPGSAPLSSDTSSGSASQGVLSLSESIGKVQSIGLKQPLVTEITVLVASTRNFTMGAGGPRAAGERIRNEVYALNDALARSGVPARFRLVGRLEVPYQEAEKIGVDLQRLSDPRPTNPYLQPVRTYRNTVRADVVTLVTDTVYSPRILGVAQGTPRVIARGLPGSTSETNAYNVVTLNGFPKHTFQHEMGHLLAAFHDWVVEPRTNPYHPNNHGYCDPQNGFRDIMTYPKCCPNCPKVPYFSNPDLRYNGAPLGSTGGPRPSNLARVFSLTAPIVATYR